MYLHKLGKDLEVGDTIGVWWRPGWDRITALTPYEGCLDCLPATRQADFALSSAGMVIGANTAFRVMNQNDTNSEENGNE